MLLFYPAFTPAVDGGRVLPEPRPHRLGLALHEPGHRGRPARQGVAPQHHLQVQQHQGRPDTTSEEHLHHATVTPDRRGAGPVWRPLQGDRGAFLPLPCLPVAAAIVVGEIPVEPVACHPMRPLDDQTVFSHWLLANQWLPWWEWATTQKQQNRGCLVSGGSCGLCMFNRVTFYMMLQGIKSNHFAYLSLCFLL